MKVSKKNMQKIGSRVRKTDINEYPPGKCRPF